MHKTKKILHSFHLMHYYLLNSLSLYYLLYSDHYNATQLQNASHISTCLMVNILSNFAKHDYYTVMWKKNQKILQKVIIWILKKIEIILNVKSHSHTYIYINFIRYFILNKTTETINFKTRSTWCTVRNILQPTIGWSPVVSPETHDHTVFTCARQKS